MPLARARLEDRDRPEPHAPRRPHGVRRRHLLDEATRTSDEVGLRRAAAASRWATCEPAHADLHRREGMTPDRSARRSRKFLLDRHRDRSRTPPSGVCRRHDNCRRRAPRSSTRRDATRIRILERPRATTGLWSWVTTVDHKKIAIMYGTTALVLLPRRRHRGAVHPAAARAARTARSSSAGALQRVLHDARHDDGVPHGHAARRRVRQLPRAADDRRARRRVPAPQHASASGSSSSAACSSTRRSSLGGAPDGGWFGYAPLTSTPLSPGLPARPRRRLLGRRPDHARHRFGRDRGQLHRHRRSTCARPA